MSGGWYSLRLRDHAGESPPSPGAHGSGLPEGARPERPDSRRSSSCQGTGGLRQPMANHPICHYLMRPTHPKNIRSILESRNPCAPSRSTASRVRKNAGGCQSGQASTTLGEVFGHSLDRNGRKVRRSVVGWMVVLAPACVFPHPARCCRPSVLVEPSGTGSELVPPALRVSRVRAIHRIVGGTSRRCSTTPQTAMPRLQR